MHPFIDIALIITQNPLFLKEITYSEEDFNIIKKELATRKIPVTLR